MGMRLGEVCDPPPSLLHRLSIIHVIIVIVITHHHYHSPHLKRNHEDLQAEKTIEYFIKRVIEKYVHILASKTLKRNRTLKFLQISGNLLRISVNSATRQKLSTC